MHPALKTGLQDEGLLAGSNGLHGSSELAAGS
jgi:hypothetical protein